MSGLTRLNYTQNTNTAYRDSASLDAFSRARVSEPAYLFDAAFEYDLQPFLYESLTNGTGAAVTHDTTNRVATMTFSSTPTGGQAELRSFESFRYQAGRSHMVLQTFNFIENATNVVKFVGLSNGSNGIELQQSGSTRQFVLYSDTAKGDETVVQSNWNIDKFDGTGPSGVTLDFTKTQILFIDLQWLGVGRIRVGFDVNGILYYAHQFVHANIQTVPYMQTANLPLRAGMTSTGTVSTTMIYICASVSSEGGQTEIGGFNFAVQGSGTAGNNTPAHILSVRPKTVFPDASSIVNHMKFVLDGVDVLVTGNTSVYWELCIGQAISGTTTFNSVNANSGFEFNTAGTISGSPTVVIASGYTGSTSGSKGAVQESVSNRYPITLNAAGAVRPNGTLSLVATGIGATSAMRAAFNWREIR